MNLIQLENVRKQFGDFTAVADLSFSIEKGSIYGLLGPNGAGKTTTLRMIMDIIAPDSGKITYSENRQIKNFLDRIGYLPEERGLYRKMKVWDVVLFIAELKGMPKREAVGEIEKWLEKMQLSEWGNKRINELSKGMAQKIQFITTVLHSPELIILDEPFSGLDPINMTLLKDMMLDLRDKGATIIFSTHVMEQVEKLCDRICLIHQGSILLEGELRAIKQSFGKSSVEIEYIGSIEPIRDSQWVQDCNDFGQYAEIKMKTPEDYRPFLRELVDKKVDVTRFELMEPTLHDIFVRSVEAHGGTVQDAE
ncbi:MAG: ATP-binding cassette domain-containing protein [Candidatus Poribacteria bacterium]|nr:ATP-binding cassette domain-containing protein [Candidatus Poribacteria bacterium]